MEVPIGSPMPDALASDWLVDPLQGAHITLSCLPAEEFLAARSSCKGLKAQCEQVAADVVCQLRRRPSIQLVQDTTCADDGTPPKTSRKSGASISPLRWVRAFAQTRAAPRLIAAGGYNSLWNDHEAVLQPEDGDGCERSVESVCSLLGSTVSRRLRCVFPKMNCQRADMTLVHGEEPYTLYAVGGRHGSRRHASVERFDLLGWLLDEETSSSWRHVPPMQMERSGLVAGVVGGLLIAAGGRTTGGRVLNEVEAYRCDADTGDCSWYQFDEDQGMGVKPSSSSSSAAAAWMSLEPMREAREYAASAFLNGSCPEFWVMGGGDSVQGSKSVEVFDLELSKWRAGPEMSLARYGAGGVEHGGRIYVVGGSSKWGQRHLTTLEALDPRSGSWEVTSFPAPKGPGFWTSLWGCSVAAQGNYLFLCGGTFREAEESLDAVFIVDLRTMELHTAAHLGMHPGETPSDDMPCRGGPLRMQVPRWCGGACMLW